MSPCAPFQRVDNEKTRKNRHFLSDCLLSPKILARWRQPVRLRDFGGLAHKLTACGFWGNISCIVGNKVLLVLQGVVTM
jgi:hypothetical protein